jgi:ribokinase
MREAIAIVGSLNMDFCVSVARLPAAGETVLGREFRMVPGGKGANQACAAAKLARPGTVVRMTGCTGFDLFADHLRASLSAAGVDTRYLRARRNAPTGAALIEIDQAGQNAIVVAPGANSDLTAADLEAARAAFDDAAFMLVQLETPLETVEAALRLARTAGAITMLDPAPAQRLPKVILDQVSILTPNESEACALLNVAASRISIAQAAEAARAIRALGPAAVVLKLGDAGCIYLDDTVMIHRPAFDVAAVDTTAAGDTFNAGLAVALAEKRSIEAALEFASAAAALSVTRHGAQSSIPLRSEVEALLRSAGELPH